MARAATRRTLSGYKQLCTRRNSTSSASRAGPAPLTRQSQPAIASSGTTAAAAAAAPPQHQHPQRRPRPAPASLMSSQVSSASTRRKERRGSGRTRPASPCSLLRAQSISCCCTQRQVSRPLDSPMIRAGPCPADPSSGASRTWGKCPASSALRILQRAHPELSVVQVEGVRLRGELALLLVRRLDRASGDLVAEHEAQQARQNRRDTPSCVPGAGVAAVSYELQRHSLLRGHAHADLDTGLEAAARGEHLDIRRLEGCVVSSGGRPLNSR